MSILKEFKEFAMRGNVLDMAVGIIIGAAFGAIVVVLWDPINAALQDSQAAVAGGFAIALVLGILLVFMGSKSASEKAACD